MLLDDDMPHGCRMAEEDATGASRHVQMRTMQDLCSGWLILHKVITTLHNIAVKLHQHMTGQSYDLACICTACDSYIVPLQPVALVRA